jgi:putative transcriptional regulator
MGREAFDAIKSGLDDALAYAKGHKNRGTKRRVQIADVDVRVLRRRLGLSQDKFAAAFGVSPSTVRNWEQGRRRPEGPARVLLHVINHEPEAVVRALVLK